MSGKRFDFIKPYFCQTPRASVCSVPFQVPFPGSPLENPQATRFYGLSEISNNPWEFIPQKLIPLLQSVLQVLEENRKNNLSPESPGKREEKDISSSPNLFFCYFNSKSRRFSSCKSDFGLIWLKNSFGLMSKLN